MVSKRIERRREKLKSMREKIESGQLNAVRELLTHETIKQICNECGHYFRSRLLTPLVIIFHMIGAAISREGSFQSAWHMSGQSGMSDSLTKARKRLPLSVWGHLHQWTVNQISEEHDSEHLWHGHRLIGNDGSCVSMPDELELAERFGKSGTKYGPSLFPIANMVFVFNLNTLVTIGHAMDHCRISELELFDRLTPLLKPGDIIVNDRRYAGAARYYRYIKAGLHFVNRAHQALQIERLEVVERFNHDDFIVKLPIPKKDRKEDPLLPEYVLVRIIKAAIRNRENKKEMLWIATSLLDAKEYPANEVKGLFKKRWRVETLIEEIKIWLSADVLRSKSVEGIFKEMHARVVATNLIHWLILKAAKQHGKKPDRISVSATLRLTAAYSLKMSTAPAWQLPLLYEELLGHIAYSLVPYRPDRAEPRMIKRKQHKYDRLKIPRWEWKLIHAMAA